MDDSPYLKDVFHQQHGTHTLRFLNKDASKGDFEQKMVDHSAHQCVSTRIIVLTLSITSCFNQLEDITPRYPLFLNVPTKLWGQPDIWQPLLGEAVRPSWLLQGVAGRNQVLCVEVDGTERHETWKATKKKH